MGGAVFWTYQCSHSNKMTRLYINWMGTAANLEHEEQDEGCKNKF